MVYKQFPTVQLGFIRRFFLPAVVFILAGLFWAAYGRSFSNRPTFNLPLPGGSGSSLSFVPNTGQSDAAVRYMAHGPGMGLFFTEDGLTFSGEDGLVRWQFVGAETVDIEGANALPGVVNYLYGQDSEKWQRGLPTYGAVRYEGLYPGVDMVYGSGSGQLEAAFQLEAGVDPAVLRWRFEGGIPQLVPESGSVALVDRDGRAVVQFPKPQVWQQIGGEVVPVEAAYTLRERGVFSLDLPSFKPKYPLVVLLTPGFPDSLDVDIANDVATDENFQVYVTGLTKTAYFPTANPLQPDYGGGEADVFVSKFAYDGRTLLFSTFLGGGSWDSGSSIAVDSDGNIIVGGETESVDFPLANPIQGDSPEKDAFVSKISADGSQLLFSTYLGGNANDDAADIGVDSEDSIFVMGKTLSPDFPLSNPIQSASGGSSEAFVSKISADGSSLLFSTYLGGSNLDSGLGLALDPSGDVFLSGFTQSDDFPVANTSIPQPPTNPINGNAFVTKMAGDGSSLLFSTLIGGMGQEFGWAIAADGFGDAIVAGSTDSGDFPVVNPMQPDMNGDGDAFVTKIAADGSSLLFSTYLGGSESELAHGIATNTFNDVYLTGVTSSPDFPQFFPLPGSVYQGGSEAFVTRLSPTGSMVSGTYLGGYELDNGRGIAVDSMTRAIVVGSTNSADFPTVNAFQPGLFRFIDAFVSRFAPLGYPDGTTLDFSTYLGGPYPEPTDVIVSEIGGTAGGNAAIYLLALGLLVCLFVAVWVVNGRYERL